MAGNVLLDIAVGAIPLLGDVLDAAFKANTRNIRLLEFYLYRPGLKPPPPRIPAATPIDVMPVRTPWGCIAAIAAVLLGIRALVLISFLTIVRWPIRTT